jgi:hypothetical protein
MEVNSRVSNILHTAEMNFYPYCPYFFIYLREIMYLRSLLSAAEHCDFVKFFTEGLLHLLLLSTVIS